MASGFFAAVGKGEKIGIVGKGFIDTYPLRDFTNEVIDARFFKDKQIDQPLLVANRGLSSFEVSCQQNGGSMVAQDDPRTWQFYGRVAEPYLHPTGYTYYRWRAVVGICENSAGVPLAGYLAVVRDKPATANSGMLSRLFPDKTLTSIFIFRPDRLLPRSYTERQPQVAAQDRQYRQERYETRQKENAEFRKYLKIGDETNCGLVINIRSPLAEIALPPTERAPNGATTFWSKIEALYLPGDRVCIYGL